jgi:predicted enzyme related to lactoylglutathione lyase
MRNACNWFEIPTADLASAQRFYEAVLGRRLQREQYGPVPVAVFPHAAEGSGGCLWGGANAQRAPSQTGTVVYLDCMPSLDAALARVEAAGGRIALPRQDLPPGMGCFAHIVDREGNLVGLHALA